MKFAMSIVVFLLLGVVLSWGTLLMLKGNYWVLVGSVVAYLLAFARIGCTEH